MHERISTPSSRTEHAPHCAMPHPNLGVMTLSSFRNTYSSGVSGEAVLLLGADSFPPLISLLHEESSNYRQQELGVLVDLSGLLVGACLQGVSEQLDLDINHSFPVVLGRERPLPELLGTRHDTSPVAAVEINYQFLGGQIHCHLLLLVEQDSIAKLNERMELLQ